MKYLSWVGTCLIWACLHGCAYASTPAHDKVHAATLFLEMERGTCSGTAVAAHSVLTAAHCLARDKLVKIDGEPVKVLSVRDDGDDHVLVVVDLTFNHIARVASQPPRVGDVVFIWGNPMGFEDLLRYGRVSGYKEHVTLLELHGWFGDSGAGVFNEQGQLVGVVSSLAGSPEFHQVGMFPMAFTDLQRRESGL